MKRCSPSGAATPNCSTSRLPRTAEPLAEALARRRPLAERADLTAYRLLHGDAEGMPGLVLDRFGDVLIIHADSPAVLQRWREHLIPLQRDFHTAYVKIHPRTASRLSPAERAQLAPGQPVWGTPVEEVTCVEYGRRFLIRPAAGLSVGLFLDMREVRAWLAHRARGRTVLNLFAYTCAFGVAASLGQASRVLNLDLSRPYLDWGKRNYALNGLSVNDHDFVYGDALDWLERLGRRQQFFDIVVLDPPSFSSRAFSVSRDYPRLAAAAARVMAPGGILLAATNHAATSSQRFDAWLAAAAAAVGRRARVLHGWHEPRPDFPVPRGGAPYLKARALRLD